MLREQVEGGFAARIADLVKRVEYRRADDWAEKEAIFRMRYAAYLGAGAIEENSSKLFTDPSDEDENAWLIGIYIDGALACSIRLHVASKPEHPLPVLPVYPDVVIPHLEAGEVIIDASRMTSQLEFARTYPFLPYVSLRTIFLAEEHFGADFVTAACLPEYQGAYRRLGRAVNWAPPRPYPPVTGLRALMAYPCKSSGDFMRERFPFLLSTPQERREMFSRSSNSPLDLHAKLTSGRRQELKDETQKSKTCAA